MFEYLGVDVERNEPYSVCKNFVLDDGGVLKHPNPVDSHGGNFRKQNSAQRVCDWRINTHHVKNHAFVINADDVNLEILFETSQRQGVVETRPESIWSFNRCSLFLTGKQ